MWLTSPSPVTGIANCKRSEARGEGLERSQVATATAASANGIATQSNGDIFRGFSAARTAPLVSEPERAASANDRSLIDWKRCSGFFSRQRRIVRPSTGETE